MVFLALLGGSGFRDSGLRDLGFGLKSLIMIRLTLGIPFPCSQMSNWRQVFHFSMSFALEILKGLGGYGFFVRQSSQPFRSKTL